MLKYEKFVSKYRASSVSDFLGNSKFFCAGSFGVYHNNHTNASSSGAVNPDYQGTKYSVQDMVKVAKPKRVFLNLAGLNDMGIFPVSSCAEDTAKEMIQIIKDISTNNPEVEIVVLSTTYMVKRNNNMSRLNNENLSIMNNLILDYCNANNVDFVDVSTLLTENGCLADKYCSDLDSLGCHLNDSGCLVWTGLLRNYAAKKIAKVYKNPESMPSLSKG
jgi:lysophospholipase L1-like esterase